MSCADPSATHHLQSLYVRTRRMQNVKLPVIPLIVTVRVVMFPTEPLSATSAVICWWDWLGPGEAVTELFTCQRILTFTLKSFADKLQMLIQAKLMQSWKHFLSEGIFLQIVLQRESQYWCAAKQFSELLLSLRQRTLNAATFADAVSMKIIFRHGRPGSTTWSHLSRFKSGNQLRKVLVHTVKSFWMFRRLNSPIMNRFRPKNQCKRDLNRTIFMFPFLNVVSLVATLEDSMIGHEILCASNLHKRTTKHTECWVRLFPHVHSRPKSHQLLPTMAGNDLRSCLNKTGRFWDRRFATMVTHSGFQLQDVTSMLRNRAP